MRSINVLFVRIYKSVIMSCIILSILLSKGLYAIDINSSPISIYGTYHSADPILLFNNLEFKEVTVMFIILVIHLRMD